MEFQFPFFPVLLCFISFMFMVLKVIQRFKSTSKLPPGLWKLPLIGNLHQLVGSPLTHRVLRDLAKKHGPLMYLYLGEVPTLVVSSAEYAKEVMKTHDIIFASRPSLLATEIMSYNTTDIVYAPYGDYWRKIRKICVLELLSVKRVQSFRPIREEHISKFVEWVFSKSGSTINLTEKLYSTTYTLIAKLAFSEESGDHEEFISVTKEVIKLTTGFNIPDVFPSLKWLHQIDTTRSKLIESHEKNDRMLDNIINEHIKGKVTTKKTRKCEDLVDVLLKFHEQGDLDQSPLTIDNIKAVILDIFVAGGESSAVTIDWTMAELIKNPRVMEKAQAEVRKVFDSKTTVDESGLAELEYLKLVIKETLRLHPPAPLLIPRENTESSVIDGYEIPVRTKVIVNGWAIGRDPKYWTDPETFYPERFLENSVDFKGTNFEYVPFGAGRRICPGITFGLANIELPLSQLLYYFDWKLPNGMNGEDISMMESFGLTVRRREDLYLIPTPYHP
ncbi:cytochrome P450 71D9-like [Tripterygium wilfordii]|uniref:cytochrome P450 71D9-like n=1 Tax=Tripterygium wilfordii TaxID=458696 RepID=UPI0018F84445|nr:cytochrome P450 71D9-like [Tripterygium wilfordii]